MNNKQILTLSLFIILSTCLYDKYSDVKQLKSADFSQTKKGIWLV